MMNKHSRTTLVLIDDDAAMVRLLTGVIDRSFSNLIEIESFTNPNDARSRLQNGVVDILVTDLKMPRINGIELLRYAKACNPTTQVIVITGHSTNGAILNSLDHGASGYLLKPVDQTELVDVIEQALTQQRRWRQALEASRSYVQPGEKLES